jgi:hypothetical protein
MGTKVTLQTLRKGKIPGSVYYVEIEVQKILSETCYIVADESEHAILTMDETPQQTSGISVGKCYRLLYPTLKDEILTFETNYRPGPISPFTGAKLTTALEKKLTPPTPPIPHLKLLKEVCDVTKNTSIPSLYLMVTFVSGDKMGPYSRYKVIRVKDHSSNSHFITLFGNCRNEVEVGGIYQFTSLMAQNYRGTGETLGRLKSHSPTKIQRASTEITQAFADVTIGDITVSGTILGHESVHRYVCCSNCKRSNHKSDKSNKCIFCGELISDTVYHDFTVIFQIIDDIGSEPLRVSVFRQDLNEEFNIHTEESFDQVLLQLHMKRITAECERNEHRDTLKALTVQITDI